MLGNIPQYEDRLEGTPVVPPAFSVAGHVGPARLLLSEGSVVCWPKANVVRCWAVWRWPRRVL